MYDSELKIVILATLAHLIMSGISNLFILKYSKFNLLIGVMLTLAGMWARLHLEIKYLIIG